MNAGNKKHTQHAPSTKTECDYLNGLETVTYAKISPQSGEPQRYNWGRKKIYIVASVTSCCFVVASERPCNLQMCRRDGSVQTVVRAATLRGAVDQICHLTRSQYTVVRAATLRGAVDQTCHLTRSQYTVVRAATLRGAVDQICHLTQSQYTAVRAATLRGAVDQTCHLTQSQYTDTRPTSPGTDLVTPHAWQQAT